MKYKIKIILGMCIYVQLCVCFIPMYVCSLIFRERIHQFDSYLTCLYLETREIF